MMKVLKISEKPDVEKLEKISEKLGRKYNMRMRYENGNIIIYVNGGYSIISCRSKYEAYLKHVLYMREYIRLCEKKEDLNT